MFMQYRGPIDWQCPCCLQLNRNRLKPLSYRLKCKNPACRRTWVHGGTLYESGGGVGRQPPPDLIPLDGGVWRNGRIHKVYCDSCSAIICETIGPEPTRWSTRPSIEKHDGLAEDLEGKDEEREDFEEGGGDSGEIDVPE